MPLSALTPEQVYAELMILQDRGVYAKWKLVNKDRWVRDSVFGGSYPVVFPIGDGRKWSAVIPTADRVRSNYRSAQSAMRSADAALAASGAILVGGVPND